MNATVTSKPTSMCPALSLPNDVLSTASIQVNAVPLAMYNATSV